MLFSATAALVALAIFTQFASPLNDTFAAKSMTMANSDTLVNTQSFGVAEVMIQTAVLMSMVLLLVRNWALPFGAMTLLIGLPSIAQLIMRDHYWLSAAVIGTGLVADVLLLRLRPPISASNLYLFAALLPGIYEASISLMLSVTVGLDWSVSLIVGSIFYAAATGLLLALMLDWPIKSQEPNLVPAASANPIIASSHR